MAAKKNTLLLKNASRVVIHGKRPGETFRVACDAEGVPLDQLWRRRLRDEERYGTGHIVRQAVDQPADQPADQPVTDQPATPADPQVPLPAPAQPVVLAAQPKRMRGTAPPALPTVSQSPPTPQSDE